MKKLKTNRLFWVMILPLIVISGCHSAHDYRYDPKKSLPGWGMYQEHTNFPINGYYYLNKKNIPTDMIDNEDSPNRYFVYIFFTNGIYEESRCEADSLNLLDYKIEHNFCYNGASLYEKFTYGSYQISNDSLFLYNLKYLLQKGKATKNIFKILDNHGLYHVGSYIENGKRMIHLTDSIWRFRPLKHKPDSTNELMKDTFLQWQMRKGYEEYINRKK